MNRAPVAKPLFSVVETESAPAAIGPYSQAVRAGNFLFLSGQIPLDPQSGKVVGIDVASQAVQALKNVQAVLGASGGTLANVVKATIYLVDLEDFAEVNRVWDEHFPANPPARACLQVSRLPRDVMVEIDITAVLG